MGKPLAEGNRQWQAAHEALVEVRRDRAGLDFREGQCLLAARRAGVHGEMGYASFAEYVERVLGYAPRVTFDKLRVAEAIERLPRLARELRDGALSFSHVRELTRVATAETEQIWLERAKFCTARQVEKLVSGRRPGSLPDAPVERELERHVLRFEVSGQTLATFREAVAKLRHDAGEHLDDDATLLLLARHVLGGPTDDGRASYQVALDVCADCQRARQLAEGAEIAVSQAATEMARCDAQWLPSAHVGAAPDPATAVVSHVAATQDVAPAVRRKVLRRDHHRCQVPGCTHASWVDVHHLETRADGGAHDASNLITLCAAHHLALHDGKLRVEGSLATGLVFRHADGTPYGLLPSPSAASIQTRAFQALRGLGFGEREARQALGHFLDASATDLETVIRRCLDRLSARSLTRAGTVQRCDES